MYLFWYIELMKTIIPRYLEIYFFKTSSGSEPVREWLKNLDIVDKKIIGEDLKTVQYGWPLGMPLVANLGHGLWEARSRLSGGKIARVIFFTDSNRIILLSGFIKKTQKTPQQELDLARKRKSLFEKALN
jgi:phage-related protein